MAALLIRDIPPALHRKLKSQAEAHRRTLSGEVLTILESALEGRSAPLTAEDIERLRARGRRKLTDELLERARKRDR